MEIRAVPAQDMYHVLFINGTPAEISRARRILDAAVLAIQDRAPHLFQGPPPVNTNALDIRNYPEQEL